MVLVRIKATELTTTFSLQYWLKRPLFSEDPLFSHEFGESKQI